MLYRPRNQLFIHISNYAHFELPGKSGLPKVSFKKFYSLDKLRELFGEDKTDKQLIDYFAKSKSHHGLITYDEKEIFIHPDSIDIYINRKNTMMTLLQDVVIGDKRLIDSM